MIKLIRNLSFWLIFKEFVEEDIFEHANADVLFITPLSKFELRRDGNYDKTDSP